MSSFLFVSTPIPAHTRNPLPFARALVRAGHRVRWYAGARYHPDIEAVGAVPVPFQRAVDYSVGGLAGHFPRSGDLSGVGDIRRAYDEVFVGQAEAQLEDLRRVLADSPADAVLTDGLCFAPGLLHDTGGPKWATFGDGPLRYADVDTPPFGSALPYKPGPENVSRNRIVRRAVNRTVYGPAQRRMDKLRSSLGLAPDAVAVMDSVVSPYLHLQGCTAGFEYPRRPMPDFVHWVGALRPEPHLDWIPPVWWPLVTQTARPVVLVTQGSIRPNLRELIRPTFQALAGGDTILVVVTGAADPRAVRRLLAGRYDNTVVTDYVPYDMILPHTDVLVTNGGYTGVTLALAHGVPMVHAGTTEEKSEIGARVAWSGTGVVLGTSRPRARAVAGAVHRVLRDVRYRAAARRVQAEMASHRAGEEGADLLVGLAGR